MSETLNLNKIIKQLSAESACLNRKIENLREAIELKDIEQIEIEFSNLALNFEEFKSVTDEVQAIQVLYANLEVTNEFIKR